MVAASSSPGPSVTWLLGSEGSAMPGKVLAESRLGDFEAVWEVSEWKQTGAAIR